MDNVTHALAGGLIAAAAVALADHRARKNAVSNEVATAADGTPTFGRTAAILAVVAAEFPDIDLVYVGRTLDGGKLAYMLHHRGHTHTVLFAVLSAIVLWAITLAVVQKCRAEPLRWSLLAVALAGTGSHLLLDFTNSYGVHPFWPVASSWYYGDALFIIEPWLWVVSLPVLWYFTRIGAVRVACAVALAAILVLAWTVDLVGRDVALALTIGAVLWGLAVRAAHVNRRWLYGVFGWSVIVGMFFVASMRARDAVLAAVEPGTFRDVSLTPAPSNPLCFRALAVQLDGESYQVTAASVAPFPALRNALACAALTEERSAAAARLGTMLPRSQATSGAVHWEQRWSAPRTSLVELVKQNCEIAAAMRFMRVPFWRVDSQGQIVFTDLRYGDRNGGFAEITTPRQRTGCVGVVPGWRPPRADISGE